MVVASVLWVEPTVVASEGVVAASVVVVFVVGLEVVVSVDVVVVVVEVVGELVVVVTTVDPQLIFLNSAEVILGGELVTGK